MIEGLEIFMTKRAISSFWLIVISVISILCFGLNGCMMLVAAVAIMTQFEFYKLLSKIDQRPFWITGMSCGVGMLLMSIFCISSPVRGGVGGIAIFAICFFSCKSCAYTALYSFTAEFHS